MKIKGTQTVEVKIGKYDLADVIMNFVQEKLGNIDDAGCDWFTKNGNTYIAGEIGWEISRDFQIAVLVDAVNVLRYNKKLILE